MKTIVNYFRNTDDIENFISGLENIKSVNRNYDSEINSYSYNFKKNLYLLFNLIISNKTIDTEKPILYKAFLYMLMLYLLIINIKEFLILVLTSYSGDLIGGAELEDFYINKMEISLNSKYKDMFHNFFWMNVIYRLIVTNTTYEDILLYEKEKAYDLQEIIEELNKEIKDNKALLTKTHSKELENRIKMLENKLQKLEDEETKLLRLINKFIDDIDEIDEIDEIKQYLKKIKIIERKIFELKKNESENKEKISTLTKYKNELQKYINDIIIIKSLLPLQINQDVIKDLNLLNNDDFLFYLKNNVRSKEDIKKFLTLIKKYLPLLYKELINEYPNGLYKIDSSFEDEPNEDEPNEDEPSLSIKFSPSKQSPATIRPEIINIPRKKSVFDIFRSKKSNRIISSVLS